MAAAGNEDHSSLHYQAELSVTSTDVSISDDRLINLAPPAAMLAARFSFFLSLRLFSPNLKRPRKVSCSIQVRGGSGEDSAGNAQHVSHNLLLLVLPLPDLHNDLRLLRVDESEHEAGDGKLQSARGLRKTPARRNGAEGTEA